ncbi:hypothetical protein SPRG_07837 [Saprolegnia parasitica CBS 223.65]|uniref:Oxidation resistance protein 1 n=1 Tax=Saprolegnia parasitica (strain CBS 223.65) TaxID=695850 RepID=A0A067CKN6_SAPPC|nr:hypothetical protein SPRG_07837 [Saprolegnia parasitica CBS 223.65]KDO27126.1 hypothetical protein SPRG_07837 [Saprolegnia parasitica CBS 223.65]|eukprot:XP_012202219.1 hypothetical protein SPRG_07837 [Saprolegnia parasitica CBS 223.65]
MELVARHGRALFSGALFGPAPLPPLPTTPSPPSSHRPSMNLDLSPQGAEITLSFEKKPLGIGLVPSTQLYGTWEVSLVPPTAPLGLEKGDVLMAVNDDRSVTSLSNEAFRRLLAKAKVPLTITFRKPKLYGHCDSHSTSTALFPQSYEYSNGTPHGRKQKSWNTRVSADQWRHVMARDDLDESEPPTDRDELGEVTITFPTKPLHMALAPSTRIYGTVEILDPEAHFPTLRAGDVLLEINNEPCTSWSIDQLDRYLQVTPAPLTMTFRHPELFQSYLATMAASPKPVASGSTVHAMFPHSREYKQHSAALSPVHTTTIYDVQHWQKEAHKLNQNGWLQLHPRSEILKVNHVECLRDALPFHLQDTSLQLLYSTQIHGFSLLQLFTLVAGKGPTICVVKDTCDRVFGAFSSCSLQQTKKVYGNGRTFVFSCARGKKPRVYAWSGGDSAFIYNGPDCLVWGGGPKGLALCLHMEDERGFSQHCTTFNNPPLAGSDEMFKIWAVEIWGFKGIRL